ncbi:MAG: gliding motility protein GldL [Bacteroidetes bacterium]|nr:gliding motility protein GldL [Bacteroidota bacterium]
MKNFVKSKKFKNFMAKLYGWGASVVIIGALFKIMHYPGAGWMLTIGLGTEAIIFFFSAFEPPHAEPDWSLVYPELAGMGEIEEMDSKSNKKKGSLTEELDKMLEDAKIGPELIQSLGDGMRNLGENAMKLSGVSDAAAATDGYVSSLNGAADSVKTLTDSYRKTSDVLSKDAEAAENYASSINQAANSAEKLAGAYNKVTETMNQDLAATEDYVSSIKNATTSALSLADKYTRSAESLTKSAEAIDFSAVDGAAYGEQIQKISKNLAALNSVYELQLQGADDQLSKTNMLRDGISNFLTNLNESVENTAVYKDQVAVLAKNVAALNTVYGNMLTAMNVNR